MARAVELGCPIVVPTISTGVDLPAQLAAEYREGWARAGHDPSLGRIGLHVHCYVGDGTTEEAREEWRPHQVGYLRWVLDDVRSPDTPMPPFMATLGEPDSQAVCGDVDDVTVDITKRIAAMGGVDVLLIQSDQGALPWDRVLGSLGRFAEHVVPELQAEPA